MCNPRDLVRGTCFIGTPSTASDGDEMKVDRRCLESISINSVLDWVRVSLLATSHSLTFPLSCFKLINESTSGSYERFDWSLSKESIL